MGTNSKARELTRPCACQPAVPISPHPPSRPLTVKQIAAARLATAIQFAGGKPRNKGNVVRTGVSAALMSVPSTSPLPTLNANASGGGPPPRGNAPRKFNLFPLGDPLSAKRRTQPFCMEILRPSSRMPGCLYLQYDGFAEKMYLSFFEPLEIFLAAHCCAMHE
ncbi:hypothetical protein DENSPDRAFT_311588 [Dentipellis sp. KUC8613]|nr:hypothetical protein DENSPDRAFT_311588 [Dentipellis sp. KUC8613]